MKNIAKKVTFTAISFVTAVMSIAAGSSASAFSSCPYDPLSSYPTPYHTNYPDSDAVNVGVRFGVMGAPYVTGVKFYKGVDNTGTHVAHLRTSGGSTDLASATFSGETSSGWQTVYFEDPVPVYGFGLSAYKVWVSMPNGHYAVDSADPMVGGDNHFNTAPSSIAVGKFGDAVVIPEGAGLYSYSGNDATVPTNETYNNYWISPIVDDAGDPTGVVGLNATDDAAGPTLDWSTPGTDTNTGGSSPTMDGLVTRSDGVTSQTIGHVNSNGYSWFDADVTARPGTNYTYGVSSIDGCGNASTEQTDTLTTASRSLTSLFSATPAADDTDTTPVTVGMHWQTSTAGKVWGARIYRAAGTMPSGFNIQHSRLRAVLWDGTTGATITSRWTQYNSEQNGWLDVRFSTPVDVDANHDYVIGYYSPNGQESYTTSAFTSAVTNSTLTARADTGGTPNGVYAQGVNIDTDEFPTNRAGSSAWYGVDVDFYIP